VKLADHNSNKLINEIGKINAYFIHYVYEYNFWQRRRRKDRNDMYS